MLLSGRVSMEGPVVDPSGPDSTLALREMAHFAIGACEKNR